MSQRLLGFDFGLQRIGVAVGQTLTQTATAIDIVACSSGKPDWAHIERLIKQWQPDALVVGYPLNMDGTTQDMTRACERFSHRLHGRFNLPTHLQDERLSSQHAEAKANFRYNPNKKKQFVDDVAAQVILERWLQQPSQIE